LGITRYYTDHWGVYARHLDAEEHDAGTRHTQHIERQHRTLRTRITRLVRGTICFAKSIALHDIVIGLCVNRYALGLTVSHDAVQIENTPLHGTQSRMPSTNRQQSVVAARHTVPAW
jgi:hypothetical protein